MTGIERQAAEWFTTMQAGDASARERTEFSQWLSQSAAHVHSYLQVATVWRDLAAGKMQRDALDDLIEAARRDAGGANIVDLQSPRPRPGERARVRGLPGWRAAIAASLLLATVAWFTANHWWQGQRYSTVIGEQTSFPLSDGSVVRLNTQSELRARITSHARDIELLRGEALFEVAADPGRPFRVQAGSTTVQAVGTVFNVYRRANEATVTVIEGKVLVASQATPVPSELRPREQMRVSSQGVIAKKRDVSLAQITAWKDRRLVFTGATLQEVTEEFNRYNTGQLRVEGELLAHLNINAVFNATDPGSLVEFLQRTEQVAVRRLGDGASVLYRQD